jgi:hypothetical protein
MHFPLTFQEVILISKTRNQLQGMIRAIGRGTRPRHDQARLVQHQTQGASDDPAGIREAFPADLVGTPAFAHGMDEREALGVDDAAHGRSGQEDLGPVLRGPEEAKPAGAFGSPGEQRARVARQPAREGAMAHAFARMQQPQGDDLAGPEVGLGVFGESLQLLIDLIDQGGDTIDGGHTALLAGEGGHRDPRGGVV